MALRATDGRQRAAAIHLRPGAYIAGTHRLFFVVAYLEEKDEVVIEDCHRPDRPQMWGTTRFLTVNGPLWVIRPAGDNSRPCPPQTTKPVAAAAKTSR